MNILWLCNIPLPNISKDLGKRIYNIGGWLEGFAEGVSKCESIELSICFPLRDTNCVVEGRVDNINYFGFPLKASAIKYKIEDSFYEILSKVNPDILHVFGTENSFSLKMINAYNKPSRTIIYIQGMATFIAKHYYSGLPFHVIYRYTLRDLIKRDNLVNHRKRFITNGVYEVESIKKANNVIGRTDWDKACCTQINPEVAYFHCNEILRNTFYNKRWELQKCNRNSIFFSQATYPIKGLHFMIKAMPEIIRHFPDTHLYIAGNYTRIGATNIKDKLLMTSYVKYLTSLINKYKLQNHITFTGSLNEAEMCEHYLKSHVFVSASTLENSSNSLSEAKILGVPSVSSFVGGMSNLITHHIDGFLYQHDAPYMLSYYIKKIFNDDKLAVNISRNAREAALIMHDKETNTTNLISIYKDVMQK